METNVLKACSIDGKGETNHWARHFNDYHKDIDKKEARQYIWDNISPLSGTPWCENWQHVLANGYNRNLATNVIAAF